MLNTFATHIKDKDLLNNAGTVLVAVSGGIDSMVLCDLLHKLGYKFAVAHCNFKLRGKDSDDDEEFVRDHCIRNSIPFYTRSFDTEIFGKEHKLSIQMAARQLRYEFFDELLKKHSFHKVLTAHHLNDTVETFFINLIRGSGINGLTGISEHNGNIVRPLLPFTKEEITTYAVENSIKHRTDTSNFDDKYMRNDIRLNIIPKLKELNPSIERTIAKEIGLLQQYNMIIANYFSKERDNAIHKKNNSVYISIKAIKANLTPELFLFELLKEYEFHPDVISNIYMSLDGIAGKLFYSDAFCLVKDRDHLVIDRRKQNGFESTLIEEGTKEIYSPIHLKMEHTDALDKGRAHSVAYVDRSKLKYPLTLRAWQNGDKFKPLGMNGFKKLSDLFVDLKLNAFEKEKVAVLQNGDKEIIWVVNHRLDDRYKVSEGTDDILKIEVID